MDKNQCIPSFFESMTNKKTEELKSALADDVEIYYLKANTVFSKEKVIRLFQILWIKFPELKSRVKEIIVENEKASVHWENSGKDRNSNKYSNEGVTLLEFENGKIIYLSDFFKNTEKF